MSRRALVLLSFLAAFTAGTPMRGEAQLLSPGRLAEAHAEVEGIRNCVSCHQLGQRGIAPDRCLSCHEALAVRIEAGTGYHASVPSDTCADCHQDHLGRDFDMLRLDEAAFDHAEAGYLLEAGHAEVECRSCHEPANIVDSGVLSFKGERAALDRTFLGLSATCAGCHEEESPHRTQFGGRDCADCHEAVEWETLTDFDHATADFALEGLHVEVACADCHGADPETAVYTPLPYGACGDCHSDPHSGTMSGSCATCHQTGGWLLLSTDAMGAFDHSRTAFPLRGSHDGADCSACHQTGSPPRSELVRIAYRSGTANLTYPSPLAEDCASCHVDRHAFADAAGRWLGCAACHSESVWAPSDFGIVRHAEESDLPLTGAHAATPCFVCHDDPDAGHTRFTLALDGRSCVDCHATDDPHEDLYVGTDCEACHVTDGFDLATFDHDLFLEPGGSQTCASCHQTDDPHSGQFEARDCASCHATDRFTIEAFDHGTTSFALDGAHETTACADCHATETEDGRPFVRYRPLGAECTDCHGGDR